MYLEREREVEIDCVQNYRNVLMSVEIERECVKRDIKGPAPVRVRVRVKLSGILSCLSFPGILSSTITSSGILCGIRFGLHRGNPRATTSLII